MERSKWHGQPLGITRTRMRQRYQLTLPKPSYLSVTICYIIINTLLFTNMQPRISKMDVQLISKQSPKLFDRMRAEIRVCHYSIRTEET